MAENTQKISAVLLKLKVNESASFPIERVRTIRAMASDFGMLHNRLYSTRTNREERTVIVTRKS